MQLKLNPPTPGVWPWLGKVLVLAAAYFVTGKLGMLLAVPPGYATCIWPPSGIALVGLLLMGSRHWPGVVLGSFCVNVGLGFDATVGHRTVAHQRLQALVPDVLQRD